MSKFDKSRPLVMKSFRTVHGHNLNVGARLTLVEGEPSAPGEVDDVMAERLWAGGIAIYEDQARPTPVETPEQEKARLAVEALRDQRDAELRGDEDAVLAAPADLVTWQQDDAETGKKEGDRVTRADLVVIAGREGVDVDNGDHKPDLIRKITERRAAGTGENSTNSDLVQGPDAGLASDEDLAARASGDVRSSDARDEASE